MAPATPAPAPSAGPIAVQPATPRIVRRMADWLLGLPVWAQALVVYLVSRIITFAFFFHVLADQGSSPWTGGEETTLRDFLNFWDAGWYERIATEGYPSVLPRGESGDVSQNAWAFYPLHPWIARNVSVLTGLDYQLVSPLLSNLFAAGAAIVILALFRRHTTAGRALVGLAIVFVFPASPILSTGYAEALNLLLLACALTLVIDRAYLWAIPVVVAMDLSRPVGVAFSFFMLIHLISRFARRGSDPYPAGEAIRSWTLGVLSCVAALIHPIHAWLRTGEPLAYLDTEHAWSGGHSRFVIQWFDMSRWLAGDIIGPVLLVGLIAGFVVLMLSPAGRQLGRDLQHFTVAYAVYLFIFFNPQTSTFRLLLPLFPLALAMAYSRSWAYRGLLLVVLIVTQYLWISQLWHFTPPSDWPP